MDTSVQEAFVEQYSRSEPTPGDLMSGDTDAAVFEAFKEVKAAAHPHRIAELAGQDFMGRGMLAHALFLGWRDRSEAEFLLRRVRQHMLDQLRDAITPHPAVYRLSDALTRFCDAWKGAAGESD